MSDSTRNWILREVLPLVVVVGGSVGGSVLWITNELADLRERVASVEGKLDLLISGLDIQVKVAAAPDQPTSSR